MTRQVIVNSAFPDSQYLRLFLQMYVEARYTPKILLHEQRRSRGEKEIVC
jgi:hypothetical protein